MTACKVLLPERRCEGRPGGKHGLRDAGVETTMSAFETIRIGPDPCIAVEHGGCGELVVLLHGIGGNRRNWRDTMPALAERFHVAAWDARGWGDSDDYDGPLSFEAMSGDLVRVLDHFGAAKAHIVGLSMGGKLAMHFVRLHPERVASLTLCDASRRRRAADPQRLAEFVRSRQQPLLEGKEPRDIAGPVARSLVSPSAQPGALEQLIDSMERLHKAMYLKAIELLAYAPDPAGLDEVDAPALVIVGADDTLTPIADAEDLAGTIPGARLAVIPNAGHLSNIEQPEAFNHALLTFLEGVPAIHSQT